ncbi:MAG: hypothetical protein AMXMBFR64_01740 [Myxococcales bacterium]
MAGGAGAGGEEAPPPQLATAATSGTIGRAAIRIRLIIVLLVERGDVPPGVRVRDQRAGAPAPWGYPSRGNAGLDARDPSHRAADSARGQSLLMTQSTSFAVE